MLYPAYESRMVKALPADQIPQHVGVMLDGNRRWAKAVGADTAHGYQAGAANIEPLLDWCEEVGVKVVTLWLLSTDNLNRPPDQLAGLLSIIEGAVATLAEAGHHLLDDHEEPAQLGGRPVEVVGGQQPEGDDLHTELVAPLEQRGDVRGAGAVAVLGVLADGFGPPAVAVEHHADVLGQSVRREPAGDPGLVGGVEHPSESVLPVRHGEQPYSEERAPGRARAATVE